MVANLCQLARDHSAFITRCDTFVAGFGSYTDFLSADMWVPILHRSADFLHCDKNLRLGCVLYSMTYYKFYSNAQCVCVRLTEDGVGPMLYFCRGVHGIFTYKSPWFSVVLFAVS